MSEHFEPEVFDAMVNQVAHAVEEGRPYLIQLPHGGKAEFLRAVADRLDLLNDDEEAYHHHFPVGAEGAYHMHRNGSIPHYHDKGDMVFGEMREVISDHEEQRGPRYRQEGGVEVYEHSPPVDDDPDHLDPTEHAHEFPRGKGYIHTHVNGWWPHRHNEQGRASYGRMRQVADFDREPEHERYRRAGLIWEYQPLTERRTESRRKHMDCMASTGCLVGPDEDCPMLQTEHAHEVSATEGYTHTHVGGHTHHEHPMNDPKLPQGGHAHIPGMPCSWCPPKVEDIQDASGVAAAFVHPVGEMDEETQRIYDEAHRKDPWPGESYEPNRSSHPSGELDAQVWAEEFVRTVSEFRHVPFDEGAMLGWFANAIMTGYDEGRRREHRLSRVDPVETDEEGFVKHELLWPPHLQSWVDTIADALAEHHGLEPSDRKWPDAKVEGTPEELAGAVYRALAPKLAELERAAHPLHEAQAWGEAQQAQARVAELEQSVADLAEGLERAEEQLADCWRLRGLAETIARQRIPHERPSAWTHVRRDTMNELREYLGINLEAEDRERQEHLEYAEWQQEQEEAERVERIVRGEGQDDG